MRKLKVLLISFVTVGVLFSFAALAAKSKVAVSSDEEGKNITAVIAEDNWAADCRLDERGRMTAFSIDIKDVQEKGDRVSLYAYYAGRKQRSIYYNYSSAGDNYSATFYKAGADGKRMFALMHELAEKLRQTYHLPELAVKEAAKKQAEYRKNLAEEAERAAKLAQKRPKPADIIKNIINAR